MANDRAYGGWTLYMLRAGEKDMSGMEGLRKTIDGRFVTAPITKQCKICLKDKTLWHFGKHRFQPDGLHYYCKQCANAKQNARKGKFAT